MEKNGKFFVSPPGEESNFKDLFKRLARSGAGRPVDENGLPLGPWTPELLADEISTLDANNSGVDLRTVQLWFQDNLRGVSSTNIRWLARVFGCGDPEATSQWQAELSAAQARLVADRRAGQKDQNAGLSTASLNEDTGSIEAKSEGRERKLNVARLSEAVFLDGRPFSAIVFLWAGLAVMLFLGYIAGTHVVTYEPADGVVKQVGLFWSPNWVLDKLIWLPIIIILASALLKRWKDDWRPKLVAGKTALKGRSAWSDKIDAHATAFWGVGLVSLVVVFFLQWYGAYLRPLVQNQAGGRVIDWLLVAIERPDVMSGYEAIAISAFANLLSGAAYWFLFAGLVLLYILANDFSEVCRSSARDYDSTTREVAFKAGAAIVRGIYCVTILSLLSSTEIKLVAVYLMTDAESIIAWLIGDAAAFFGWGMGSSWAWFDKSPSASITSFFVLFIPSFVFFVCLAQVLWALHQLKINFSMTRLQHRSTGMIAVILLFIVNFWSMGRFQGFSILLAATVLIGICSMIAQGLAKRTQP